MWSFYVAFIYHGSDDEIIYKDEPFGFYSFKKFINFLCEDSNLNILGYSIEYNDVHNINKILAPKIESFIKYYAKKRNSFTNFMPPRMGVDELELRVKALAKTLKKDYIN